MKNKAHNEGRDLLLIDTGDLHDGTGLSDTTALDGEITDEIFKYIDYDVLSVGHALFPPLRANFQESRVVCGRHYQGCLPEIRSTVQR